MKTAYQTIAPFITKDGSEIRELMHPAIHGDLAQSLAEAIIHPGEKTQLHFHRMSEELYHVTQGAGLMTLGAENFAIAVGDTGAVRRMRKEAEDAGDEADTQLGKVREALKE